MNLHIIPVFLYLFAAGVFGVFLFGTAAVTAGLGGHKGVGLLQVLFWLSVAVIVFSFSAQLSAWAHLS